MFIKVGDGCYFNVDRILSLVYDSDKEVLILNLARPDSKQINLPMKGDGGKAIVTRICKQLDSICVEENNTLTIYMEGGCLRDVEGLPEGWDYIVHDYDDDPDDVP